MAMFPIPGNNIEIWTEEIKSKLLRKGSTNVQVIILIIPGRNGKSQLYRELKRLTLEEIPIVTQIILTSTINFGKNLKSITTKVLTQICAKAGGIPWTIDNLPLFDKRIMICGLDAFHETKTRCKSVIGFVASYNRSATKYWSKSVV
jgi:aubergine-like protein